jgi:photosystem II stability/assembly factor-like uncharacterized protein
MPKEPFVYVGLAGDTDPGRFVSAGLFRSRGASAPWQSIGEAVHAAPQVRAIATDPRHHDRVTIGTQLGIYRSDDGGDHWRRLPAPAPELAVWSLAFDPHDPEVMLAGYEPAAILRTVDGGETWTRLAIEVAFPDVTIGPDMPKRVTGIAVDDANPDEIYASIEIGGLLRSVDGGTSWTCVTDGLYTVEDSVDLHAVALRSDWPGTVTVATRVGCFRSADRGAHWRDLRIPMLRPRGTYCRALAAAPDDPDTLYVGAGNDFDGDKGALFTSSDDGRSWRALDLGVPVKSTVFGFAVDPRSPERLFCATKYGGVFRSDDRGASWRLNPLPPGAGHVFALAAG